MCGLAGWCFTDYCSLTHEQRKTMLLLSGMGADKRGGESWGTLTVDNNGQHEISKGLGPLVAADFNKLAEAPMGYAHSRLPTKGALTVQNQHPFIYEHIIGAHNGVITNSSALDRLFGDKNVDSEHIFERIANGDDLSKLEGYGVIEFYDRRYPKDMYLCNMGNGDLALFELYDPTNEYIEGYFWTSNKDDGELALAAGGVKYFKAFTLTEGRVYNFKMHTGELFYLPDKELKISRSYSSYGNYRGPSYGGYSAEESYWNSHYGSTSSSNTSKDDNDKVVKELLAEYPSLAEQMLTEEWDKEDDNDDIPSIDEANKMMSDSRAWELYKKKTGLDKLLTGGSQNEADKKSCALHEEVDLVESMNEMPKDDYMSEDIDFREVREKASGK